MIKKIILAVSLLFIGCAGTQVTNKSTKPVSKKVAVSKEYNENIILNKPESKKSNILTLYVTGEGVAPVNAINAAQAKVLARRALLLMRTDSLQKKCTV